MIQLLIEIDEIHGSEICGLRANYGRAGSGLRQQKFRISVLRRCHRLRRAVSGA